MRVSYKPLSYEIKKRVFRFAHQHWFPGWKKVLIFSADMKSQNTGKAHRLDTKKYPFSCSHGRRGALNSGEFKFRWAANWLPRSLNLAQMSCCLTLLSWSYFWEKLSLFLQILPEWNGFLPKQGAAALPAPHRLPLWQWLFTVAYDIRWL